MSGAGTVLFLAPHPDDELVGAAIALARAKALDVAVSVLFLTTGIPQECWPWEGGAYANRVQKRREEAGKVAERLGFDIEAALEIPSRRLIDHLDGVRAVLSKLKADQLWVPAYEGAHQDHDAANALGFSLRSQFEVIEFAEYNFAGGRVNANRFPDGGGEVLTLTGEEMDLKRQLLGLYASERGNLDYVGCVQECRRPLASYDYARPAHEGRLFRERFRWVPFRHPRIDWMAQAHINAALSKFTCRFA